MKRMFLLLSFLLFQIMGCGEDEFTVIETKTQTDIYQQTNAASIDILWVVDNSPTMVDDQQRIASAFNNFISVFNNSGLDYQMAIVSTDMTSPDQSGNLLGNPKVIKADDSDPVAEFKSNIILPSTGNPKEEGLRAARTAIKFHGSDFIRSDASLAIIFISDEDDHSVGEINYYARFFMSLKGPGNERKIKIAAIVGDKDSGCQIGNVYVDPGTRYIELVEYTDGVFVSLCSDFSATLVNLANSISGLRRKFALSKTPVVSTIKVKVNGEDIPQDETNGWVYESQTNSIFFKGYYIPPAKSKVSIFYEVAQ